MVPRVKYTVGAAFRDTRHEGAAASGATLRASGQMEWAVREGEEEPHDNILSISRLSNDYNSFRKK
jgi:hypothetical protein